MPAPLRLLPSPPLLQARLAGPKPGVVPTPLLLPLLLLLPLVLLPLLLVPPGPLCRSHCFASQWLPGYFELGLPQLQCWPCIVPHFVPSALATCDPAPLALAAVLAMAAELAAAGVAAAPPPPPAAPSASSRHSAPQRLQLQHRPQLRELLRWHQQRPPCLLYDPKEQAC